MKVTYALLALLITFSAQATSLCSQVEGFHEIISSGKNFYLGFYIEGEAQFFEREGDLGFIISKDHSGGVNGGHTYTPLVWSVPYGARNAVDAIKSTFASGRNWAFIQLFEKADYPHFYKSIGKKVLKELQKLEANEDNELLVECLKKKIEKDLK